MEYISTSTLANALDIKSNELFEELRSLGWIERKNDKWILTEIGIKKGGQTRNHPKFGEYIVWPENISIESKTQENKAKLLNATAISKIFNVSSQRLNLILSELGLIQKDIAGWKVTKLGKSNGGKQFEHETSGGTYVLWPDSILTNNSLVSTFKENIVNTESQKHNENGQDSIKKNNDNFREKFPATLRTKDGHLVRSRAEVIIDNALYDYKLAHAYERKLPIEEEVYSDFFIPIENVYIEFWGMEDDPKYAERKKTKIEIYKKYDFNLIELNDNDISNLDDHLPKKLLQFGIKVY